MFNPADLTLGQVSSALRDFTIVGVLLTAAWKARGGYELVKNFFERLTKFMASMEADSAFIRQGMQTLLSNHLTHIEADLRNMAHRQVRASHAEQASYVDEPPYEGEVRK